MEYLMTYGWAILIIAVVLGALFSLGVFNGANFAPKAPPGACQVFRPNGPGTTSFVNLEGVCNGELPEYVTSFNGASSVITVPSSTSLSSLPNGVTWTVWFYVPSSASGTPALASQFVSASSWIDFWFSSTTELRYEAGSVPCDAYTSGSAVSPNTWYFAALVYSPSSNTVTGYLDNNNVGSCSGAGLFTQDSAALNIGAYSTSPYFNGYLANFQDYNTSLSGPEVNALYLEGIGGAPIDLQNLVAWWPLNGNANDYSGNMNNGQATNVIYTSSWTNGYTAP